MRARFGDRAPWLVETTLLRRRAAGKLGELCPNVGVSQWLFTDEALQQATAAPVARHRARRLAGRVVHDATCSIGTELAALRELAVRAVGSDIDRCGWPWRATTWPPWEWKLTCAAPMCCIR